MVFLLCCCYLCAIVNNFLQLANLSLPNGDCVAVGMQTLLLPFPQPLQIIISAVILASWEAFVTHRLGCHNFDPAAYQSHVTFHRRNCFLPSMNLCDMPKMIVLPHSWGDGRSDWTQHVAAGSCEMMKYDPGRLVWAIDLWGLTRRQNTAQFVHSTMRKDFITEKFSWWQSFYPFCCNYCEVNGRNTRYRFSVLPGKNGELPDDTR